MHALLGRAVPLQADTHLTQMCTNASLAQLAEHALRKRTVGGSIPPGGFSASCEVSSCASQLAPTSTHTQALRRTDTHATPGGPTPPLTHQGFHWAPGAPRRPPGNHAEASTRLPRRGFRQTAHSTLARPGFHQAARGARALSSTSQSGPAHGQHSSSAAIVQDGIALPLAPCSLPLAPCLVHLAPRPLPLHCNTLAPCLGFRQPGCPPRAAECMDKIPEALSSPGAPPDALVV